MKEDKNGSKITERLFHGGNTNDYVGDANTMAPQRIQVIMPRPQRLSRNGKIMDALKTLEMGCHLQPQNQKGLKKM